MKVRKLGRVKPKTRVFADVATRAKMTPLAPQHDTAQIGVSLNSFENRFQLKPHRTRHGIELTLVHKGNESHAALLRVSG